MIIQSMPSLLRGYCMSHNFILLFVITLQISASLEQYDIFHCSLSPKMLLQYIYIILWRSCRKSNSSNGYLLDQFTIGFQFVILSKMQLSYFLPTRPGHANFIHLLPLSIYFTLLNCPIQFLL